MSHAASRIFQSISLICVAGIAATWVMTDSRWTAPQAQAPELSFAAIQELNTMTNRAVVSASIAQRPLFLATRRPYEPPVLASTPDEPAHPNPFSDVELLGIFGSGSNAGVVLRHDGQTSRISLGAPWTGWQLKAVDAFADEATFTAPDRGDHVLRLRRQPQQGEIFSMFEAQMEPSQESPAEVDTDEASAMASEPPEQTEEGAEEFLMEGAGR